MNKFQLIVINRIDTYKAAEEKRLEVAQAQRDHERMLTEDHPALHPEHAAPVATVTKQAAVTEAIDPRATIKLGDICDRFGFTVTADFLAKLGFQPVVQNRQAKLYREADFWAICTALIAHIERAAMREAA